MCLRRTSGTAVTLLEVNLPLPADTAGSDGRIQQNSFLEESFFRRINGLEFPDLGFRRVRNLFDSVFPLFDL